VPRLISTDDTLRRAPKALLHDHLDGGLRPQTIVELADAIGYQGLAVQEADALGAWFRGSAGSGSLERYLETFDQTLAVMQTVDGLHRVASECVQDLADDGVVYAEVRYAPEQHLVDGLALEDVVEAVNAGFRDGERIAAGSGRRIRVTALLTAMRHAAKGTEIAELVVRYRDDGVAGFDIAGAEAGFPPTRHLDAFEYLRRENAHFTIHAGEAFGLPSIWEAIQWCGADRLGHGVRIVDDFRVAARPGGTSGLRPGGTSRLRPYSADVAYAATADPAEVALGGLASYVRDRRIPLEMCPSSNVQTGAAESVALHPISLLKRLRFRVTVNTDNRLMSGTSMTREMSLLVNDAGWTLEDLRWVTINAMKSAFIPFDERLAIIDDVVKPGYAALSQDALSRDALSQDALSQDALSQDALSQD
jgi:adenosine deaminase